MAEDYRTTSLSLKAHPLSFFRARLMEKGVRPTRDLAATPNGRRARVAGLVLIRQRPGTAKGVTFVTLEDETGIANLVVWPDRFEAARKTVMTSRFLCVEGKVQREGDVIHLVAERFEDLSAWLADLREAGPPPSCRRAGTSTEAARRAAERATEFTLGPMKTGPSTTFTHRNRSFQHRKIDVISGEGCVARWRPEHAIARTWTHPEETQRKARRGLDSGLQAPRRLPPGDDELKSKCVDLVGSHSESLAALTGL